MRESKCDGARRVSTNPEERDDELGNEHGWILIDRIGPSKKGRKEKVDVAELNCRSTWANTRQTGTRTAYSSSTYELQRRW